jgi:hypothetical protein
LLFDLCQAAQRHLVVTVVQQRQQLPQQPGRRTIDWL